MAERERDNRNLIERSSPAAVGRQGAWALWCVCPSGCYVWLSSLLNTGWKVSKQCYGEKTKIPNITNIPKAPCPRSQRPSFSMGRKGKEGHDILFSLAVRLMALTFLFYLPSLPHLKERRADHLLPHSHSFSLLIH